MIRITQIPAVKDGIRSEDPETTLKWKITNPNGYAVDADWKIILAQPVQTGTLTVPGRGEVIFYFGKRKNTITACEKSQSVIM